MGNAERGSQHTAAAHRVRIKTGHPASILLAAGSLRALLDVIRVVLGRTATP